MSAREAQRLVDTFVAAWPEAMTDDAAQVERLFAAYDPDTVRQVIADRLEADLPRPGLAELSRVLRVYQGIPSKDPEPEPPVTAPRRSWISDMEAAPPIPDDLSDRVAELRACIGEPPEPRRLDRVVVDRDALKVVPPEVYAAAEEGKRLFQESRRSRLDAAR